MPPRKAGASGASLDALRAAVARRVADTSARQVAREIGISHQALTRFIRGETQPYGTTVAKIRAWYDGEANEVDRLRQEVTELKRQLADCQKRLGKK